MGVLKGKAIPNGRQMECLLVFDGSCILMLCTAMQQFSLFHREQRCFVYYLYWKWTNHTVQGQSIICWNRDLLDLYNT